MPIFVVTFLDIKEILPYLLLIIFLFYFAKPIIAILEAITALINRIDSLRFKQLELLASKDVPMKIKEKLINQYKKSDIKEAIALFTHVINSFNILKTHTNNSKNVNTRAQEIATCCTNLQNFLAKLELLPQNSELSKKILLLNKIITIFKQKPKISQQISFEVSPALQELDPEPFNKDAVDFIQLKELYELLINLYHDEQNT